MTHDEAVKEILSGHSTMRANDPLYRSKEWRVTQRACLKRDSKTCQRCLGHYKGPGGDTVVVWRIDPEGGDANSNFVTLCSHCRDYADLNQLRTLADIKASLPASKQHGIIADRPAERPDDWRSWVYGGADTPHVRCPPIDVIGDALARVAADALAEVQRQRAVHGQH